MASSVYTCILGDDSQPEASPTIGCLKVLPGGSFNWFIAGLTNDCSRLAFTNRPDQTSSILTQIYIPLDMTLMFELGWYHFVPSIYWLWNVTVSAWVTTLTYMDSDDPRSYQDGWYWLSFVYVFPGSDDPLYKSHGCFERPWFKCLVVQGYGWAGFHTVPWITDICWLWKNQKRCISVRGTTSRQHS